MSDPLAEVAQEGETRAPLMTILPPDGESGAASHLAAADMAPPARSLRERWLRWLAGPVAVGTFPSRWRKLAIDGDAQILAQYAHAARFGWVTITHGRGARRLRWGWRCFEPRWEPAPVAPELPQPRELAAASKTSPQAPVAALVQLGAPSLSMAPSAAPEPRVRWTLLPPPAEDTARFHVSSGPDWVFRVLERYIQAHVRIPRTAQTKELWTRKSAPGGAIESFPIGWNLVEVLLPRNGEDLLLVCGRDLPQGKLLVRLHTGGKLLAVEWRSPDLVPDNLHDTDERRAQLSDFTRRLATRHAIAEALPDLHEPRPRPTPAEIPPPQPPSKPAASTNNPPQRPGKRHPKQRHKHPSPSGSSESGFRIDNDLEFIRRTQGDNWY